MKTLAELETPRQVDRRVLERDVQRRCVEWARARGYWARKFSSQSQRSVPDYLMAKVGVIFAVEFKAPGSHGPTEAQADEMAAMTLAGWRVFWCSSVEMFKQQVETIEAAGA